MFEGIAVYLTYYRCRKREPLSCRCSSDALSEEFVVNSTEVKEILRLHKEDLALKLQQLRLSARDRRCLRSFGLGSEGLRIPELERDLKRAQRISEKVLSALGDVRGLVDEPCTRSSKPPTWVTDAQPYVRRSTAQRPAVHNS